MIDSRRRRRGTNDKILDCFEMSRKQGLAYCILGGIIFLNIVMILATMSNYNAISSASYAVGLPPPAPPLLHYLLNVISIVVCIVLAFIVSNYEKHSHALNA